MSPYASVAKGPIPPEIQHGVIYAASDLLMSNAS